MIYIFRDQKVMIDSDLAELYGVSTKRLNEQVRRNRERFPEDFMFQISKEELLLLRSQFATSKKGGRRYLPYAFTEQGVAMLSSVLKSKRAIQVNIAIMRTFVELRNILATHKDLARKLENMERQYDEQFRAIFEVIRHLMSPPAKTKRRIGFKTPAMRDVTSHETSDARL
jgi:phage regulator Rha-like protein